MKINQKSTDHHKPLKPEATPEYRGESMKIDLEKEPADFIGLSWGVIDSMAEGTDTIRDLCEQWGISQTTFYRTCELDKELKEALFITKKIRAARYADEALKLTEPQTKKIRKYTLGPDGKRKSEEIIEASEDWGIDNQGRYTANSGKLQRDAMRVKTLLHLAAKFDPEQFGDRVITEHQSDGKATLIIGDTSAAAELIHRRRQQILEAPRANDNQSEQEYDNGTATERPAEDGTHPGA